MAKEPDDWITTAQAAERLGVSASRVRQLILAGELPAKALTPRLNLVSAAAVGRYQRRKPGPAPKKKAQDRLIVLHLVKLKDGV